MARPTAAITRERADLYATRRMVVELLRHMENGGSRIIESIQNSTARGVLKPIDADVIISEEFVRDAFAALLDEASGKQDHA